MALRAALERLVWSPELRSLPRWRRLPLRLARIVYAVVRDLADGQLTLRAMSLVYTTLLSLVPLLAVSFSLLKGLGVHYQFEPLLAKLLVALGDQGVEVTGRIIEFVENVRAGVLGTVGLAFLLFTVISLIQKIEGAFNFTWRVSSQRPLGQRFSNYLSVILVGPALVVAALGITATVTHAEAFTRVVELLWLGPLVQFISRLVPYLLVIGAFTFIYTFVPNTRVRLRSALVGALVAGVLWESCGWAFTSFVAGSTKYTAIYSAFATLILFMIWLFLSWLILLIGASIAFYHQHPAYLVRGGRQPRLSIRQREHHTLAALCLIAGRFQQGAPALGAERLALQLALPQDQLVELLEPLLAAGLLLRSERGDYLPARAPVRITL
ncbi:MAG TPA: YihY/virulence factor BrkB family protein, partial [Gammaproteobacteria bacterium]